MLYSWSQMTEAADQFKSLQPTLIHIPVYRRFTKCLAKKNTFGSSLPLKHVEQILLQPTKSSPNAQAVRKESHKALPYSQPGCYEEQHHNGWAWPVRFTTHFHWEEALGNELLYPPNVSISNS